MSPPHSPPGSHGESEDTPMADTPTIGSEAQQQSYANFQPMQTSSNIVAGASVESITNGKETSSHGEPGSSWNTKKFQDEYEKAYSQLLDKGWSMKPYGDLLLRER